MSRTMIGIAFIFAAGVSPVRAADIASPREVAASRIKHCDVCGCLRTYYVHHRALLSTYGANFDPNNYDFTEPRYFYGPERPYPRYSLDPS